MATLVKRGKTWSVVYNDHTGRQRWVKAYKDKRESQGLADRLEVEKRRILNGDVDPQLEQRKAERAKGFTEHVEEHIAALRAKSCTSIHVDTTSKYLADFGRWAAVTHASQISRPLVERYVNALKAGETGLTSNGKRTPSFRTINARVGALQSLLKRLQEQGVLTEYVLRRFPKLKLQGNQKRKPRAMTAQEVKSLLKVSDRAELYRFCLLTGARHSQAAALTQDDVNFRAGTITLRAKDNLHRNRVHVVPLHPRLKAMLKECIQQREDQPLLDVPPRGLAAKLIRKDCEAAGVPTKGIQFHSLRHTFCTRLAEQNVHPAVLQALAGHQDLKTTLGYYVHFRREDERTALGLLAV